MSTARIGVEGLAQDLAEHRVLVGSSNAIVARELALLETLLSGPRANAAILERLGRAWKNRTFCVFYERPLLLAAALRLEAMTGGHDHPLAAALATEPPDPNALDLRRLARVLDPERLPIWLTLATRKVQTNDVSRAIVWQWPATLAKDRPLVLVDIGCSAGLNLVADALPLSWTDQAGRRLPKFAGRVAARIGFDADPVDPTRPADVEWLRACLWPGDVERQQQLERALEAVAAAAAQGEAPVLQRVRAGIVVSRLQRIEQAAERSALVVVLQTFVREYIDESEATPYLKNMAAWLRRLPPGRVLWLQLELAHDGKLPAGEILAQTSGGVPLPIGRCGYHPRSVEVEHERFADLRRAIDAFVAR